MMKIVVATVPSSAHLQSSGDTAATCLLSKRTPPTDGFVVMPSAKIAAKSV
jgi:hypothetical protein